ncbi:MAG: sugar ABC transporter permease [Candidatus Cloacimonetes bacterium]|jgi:D-xylose transport system permease protein|nr:sugar ABC transporter permease [Candidatus Cloacimonadota bacterium]
MNSFKKYLKTIELRNFVMIGALLLIWVVFSTLTGGSFLLTRNISNLVRHMALVGILGIGMTMVIITGNIDLSVGSILGAMGGLAAVLHVWYGVGTYQTIGIVLLVSMIIGTAQGAIISYLKVPAFIVTLGGLLIFRGVQLGLTKGISIAPFADTYKIYGQAYIAPSIVWVLAIATSIVLFLLDAKKRSDRIKYKFEVSNFGIFIGKNVVLTLIILFVAFILNSYRGLPMQVFLMMLLVVIFTFVTQKTTFGRSIYAMGGNFEASLYSGIKVKRNLVIVYAINGLMAGIAAVVITARLNAGTPTAGMNMELDAIASSVIGGTSMSGGVGKVYGAILGALFMASIDNGMSMMNIDAYWQYIVKGVILVVAVWFDIYSSKKA